MKMKNIMIITFLLLAVLTIGAASATDDVASDDLADNGDIEVITNDGATDVDDGDGGDETDDEDDSNDEDDGTSIEVNNVNKGEYDKNFVNVTVSDRNVKFVISADDYDETVLFEEDLSTTNRVYDEIEYGESTLYKFSFTFNDVNNYISEHIDDANNFDYLITHGIVNNKDDVYFSLEDDEGDEVDSETMTIYINEGSYRFVPEGEDIDVEYAEELEITMYDDNEWKNKDLLYFWVPKDTKGKIVIYINDEETASYEKDFTQLTPDEEESDEESNYYIIKVGNLNIDQDGEYILRVYLLDEDNNYIWEYDEDDGEPAVLILHNSQIAGNDNATIEPAEYGDIVIIDDNTVLITINTNITEGDVVIYVNDDKNPIIKEITSFDRIEDNYIITVKDLDLNVGEYNLNITYMGANLVTTVNLISNLIIDLPEDDDDVITTGDDFNDAFVEFDLHDNDDEDIQGAIEGTINVIIYDDNNNVVDTLQRNIDKDYDGESGFYVVRVNELQNYLNGTYLVSVQYIDGNQYPTNKSAWVQFKLFDPADYKTSVKDTIENEDDYIITFTELPPADEVIVKIDGIETTIDEMDLFDNEDDGVYFIKLSDLGPLDEGSHSIVVGIEVGGVFKELAKTNVIVDLEENIDPALTITVANIEEGNAATVVITTNNTFTGNITVQIANTNYQVNVVKGQGSTQINGLKANTYTATALFKSDGIFTDATKAATFTVTAKPAAPSTPAAPAKKVIKLTLKKVKVKKSAKKLVLKATLKINGKAPKKGTKIKFTFKGKKYIGKTNKKGVAKVIIKKKVLKKLKVGKKVKYTAKYSTKTVKRTAKVKR